MGRIRQRRGANRRLHQNMPKNIPFCDFLDVDLQSKNTKGNSKAHTYSEERKKSLVLGAMMGKFALVKACHAGNLSSVQKLVIDFGVSAKQDSMALHSASDAGYHEIVQFLLRQGAEANIGLLIKCGADPSRENKFGATPIMYAAYYGHLTAFVSFVQQNPLEWEPKLHTLFPMEIQDKVRAILTAAQASDNRILQRMPLYILLNTISQFAKLEMW